MQTSQTTWFVSNIGTPEPSRPSPPPPQPAPPVLQPEPSAVKMPPPSPERSGTSLAVPYFNLAGTVLLLIGLGLLTYSTLTAVSLDSASATYWVGGLSFADVRRLTPADNWGWTNVFVSLVELPGRIMAWWGCLLLVVGGGVTAFSLSFRPRVRAGR